FPISASLCREGITAFFWFVFETRTGTASFFASAKYSGESKWDMGRMFRNRNRTEDQSNPS
ncbi:MAG TPA: hypothetical protein VGF06_05665, partial [Terriglobales bacterium]